MDGAKGSMSLMTLVYMHILPKQFENDSTVTNFLQYPQGFDVLLPAKFQALINRRMTLGRDRSYDIERFPRQIEVKIH